MRKTWIHLTCLIGTVMVFAFCFLYGSLHISMVSSIQVESGFSDAADTYSVTELSAPVSSEEAVSSEAPESSQTPESKATPESKVQSPASSKAAQPKKQSQKTPVANTAASPENKQVENDKPNTSNGENAPVKGDDKPLDDSASSSESSSSGTPEVNELEKKVSMPAYTPYGKTLTVIIGGQRYTADAVVVVSAMTQCEMVGNTPNLPSYYTEAYRAQAVASHSYVKEANNRGQAASVLVSKPSAQTVRIVESVIDQLVYYNGKVAQAFYFASSGGSTQGSQFAWNTALPYLVAVDSKYDESPSTVTKSKDEVAAKLSANGYDTSGHPSGWFHVINLSDGGFVNDIDVCGRIIKGRNVQSLMGLRSSKFSVSFDGNSFTFSVLGYGHGVGMSQLGAMGYSRYDGWSYRQILLHYYTGCTVG